MEMKAKRAKTISRINIKNGKESADFLYQWGYARKMSNGTKSAFVSIIQRGKDFYLDKPYYCFAGEHAYRKLSGNLVIAIKLAGLHGEIDKIKRQIKNKINDLKYGIARYKAGFKNRIENKRFMKSLKKSLR
jgi:hypothetical protein